MDTAKDTVAETFWRGPQGVTRVVPSLFANGHGLDIRRVVPDGDSVYGKCWIVDYSDTVFGRFESGTNMKFRVAFDGARLSGFQHGRQFRIELRRGDSSCTSPAGTIEGKFIDADTLPDATLALSPGFRDVAITRHVGLPDTVDAGDSYPRNVSVRNYSDLRDEEVTVVMTRRQHGVLLDSAAATVTLKPPHFQPDTALVGFPVWQVAPADSGENVLSYLVSPSDSVPDNNLRSETVFVRDGAGLAGDGQNRAMRVLPTVLRAPVDLQRVEGDLYDVLGRPAKGAWLGAGIYYLIAPECTRKLLVVR